MIFIIEDSFIEANDENLVQFLENIMIGYQEGNHLLYIKRKTLDKIYKNYASDLNPKALKSLYYYEENQLVESKALLDIVSHAIKIIPHHIEEKITKEDNIIFHMLHCDNFLLSANIQKTTILGENLSDANIYKFFSDYYIENLFGDQRLITKCRMENGGGSTTAPVFSEKISKNEELCITLLDSDRKFPSQLSLGETANRVKRISNRTNPKKSTSGEGFELINVKKGFAYIEKKTRELENMLPYAFLKKEYSTDIHKFTCVSEIFNFLEKNDSRIFHLDLKKGLTYFDVLDQKSDWSSLKDSHLIDQELLKYHAQDTIKKKECSCKILSGLGTKILEDFIQYIEKIDISQLCRVINNSHELIKSIWQDIGKIIFSWCCGQKSILTNI